MSISDVFHPIYFDSLLLHGTKRNFANEFIKSDQTIQTNLKSIHRPKKKQNNINNNNDLKHIIFLDWDDTLMPTTYLLSFIDYEIEQSLTNPSFKKIKTFTISNKCSQKEICQFINNLEKAGNSAYKLLLKIFNKFDNKNIKIITNGVNGWIVESLKVASSFCKIYKKIQDLIFIKNKIEIIYARNENLNQMYWKTKCFDKLLWRYFSFDKENKNDSSSISNINIITIGDQWTDHSSINESLTYYIYGEFISHHQIKLFENPDCRYLCVELNYISDILNQELLFKFHSFIKNGKTEQEQQGLVLEFDGYNNDN